VPYVGDRLAMNHFPRTGGSYLSMVLESWGHVRTLPGDSHRILSMAEVGDRTCFVVLRDPAQWIFSYVVFRRRGGRPCVPEIDSRLLYSDTCYTFARSLPPGILDLIYRRFVGTPYPTHRLHYDSLPMQLSQLLLSCGMEPSPITWNCKIYAVPGELETVLRERNPYAFEVSHE
jgi:hypothetical protein